RADEADYGTLVLAEAGAAVRRGGREVPLRKEPKRPGTARTRGGASGSGRGERRARAAAELPEELVPVIEALRAWRAEQAREQGVPAYVIFHDATLREIATARPTSVAELGGIGGVGEKKLATYGEGVLQVLAAGSGGPGTAASAAPERAAAGASDPAGVWPEEEPEPDPWA